MITHLAKWGNSLALRLPAALAREVRVDEGTAVDISVEDGAIVIRPAAGPADYDLDALLDGITDDNRHAETFWGGSVGNEV